MSTVSLDKEKSIFSEMSYPELMLKQLLIEVWNIPMKRVTSLKERSEVNVSCCLLKTSGFREGSA